MDFGGEVARYVQIGRKAASVFPEAVPAIMIRSFSRESRTGAANSCMSLSSDQFCCQIHRCINGCKSSNAWDGVVSVIRASIVAIWIGRRLQDGPPPSSLPA